MNLDTLCQAVRDIAQQAGQFIAQEAAHFSTDVVEYKGLNNVVSYVDKETEKMLVERLSALLPEAGFITEEETTAQERNKEWLWIIDPLDGTANFVHGLPLFSVSIGLMHQQKMVLGVIYEVTQQRSFWAVRGGGAFCNDTPIHVSRATTLPESLLATGFPYYDFDKMPQYLHILQALMRKTHGLRRLGSAAIDLAYVACGWFEGFYEYNLNSWDMAAGVLIVEEAGGQVSDFSGGDNYILGGDVIASNRLIHKELLQTIQDLWH